MKGKGGKKGRSKTKAKKAKKAGWYPSKSEKKLKGERMCNLKPELAVSYLPSTSSNF